MYCYTAEDLANDLFILEDSWDCNCPIRELRDKLEIECDIYHLPIVKNPNETYHQCVIDNKQFPALTGKWCWGGFEIENTKSFHEEEILFEIANKLHDLEDCTDPFCPLRDLRGKAMVLADVSHTQRRYRDPNESYKARILRSSVV